MVALFMRLNKNDTIGITAPSDGITKKEKIYRLNSAINNMNKAGFNIKESCRDYIFPILVHCMENINIFNEEQLENINQISNKLIYG